MIESTDTYYGFDATSHHPSSLPTTDILVLILGVTYTLLRQPKYRDSISEDGRYALEMLMLVILCVSFAVAIYQASGRSSCKA